MKIRLWAVAVSAIVLTGCVRFDLDKSLSQTNSEFTEFTTGNLQLLRTQEQREQARSRADSILDEPLDQAAAVELALLNSPAVQTMLANHWDQSSSTALSGSIPNPVFEFGRPVAFAYALTGRKNAIRSQSSSVGSGYCGPGYPCATSLD